MVLLAWQPLVKASHNFPCAHHLDTREWTLVKAEDSKFPARSGHSAVAIGQRIFVFGGLNSMACEVYNDVRVFDTRKLRFILLLRIVHAVEMD